MRYFCFVYPVCCGNHSYFYSKHFSSKKFLEIKNNFSWERITERKNTSFCSLFLFRAKYFVKYLNVYEQNRFNKILKSPTCIDKRIYNFKRSYFSVFYKYSY